MEITNPSLNASLSDGSKNDDSFQQSGTTVNIGSGGTYNQNSGNGRRQNQAHPWITIALLGAAMAGGFWVMDGSIRAARNEEALQMAEMSHQLELALSDSGRAHAVLERHIKDAETATAAVERHVKSVEDRTAQLAKATEVAKSQAREGTIWLLRDDILKSIERFESTRSITQKQYKRLKDEYEYYASIGGNHDVKDRFDDLFARIYGTGEIKMVPDDGK